MVHRTEDGREDFAAEDVAADVLHVGWEQTVQDMRTMAGDRERKGYETLTIPSGNTAPIAPSQGNDVRFGFSHLADHSKGQDFLELYEGRNFTDTGVYQIADGGHVFMVTEHIDYDDEIVIFIAGTYRVMDAADLVRAATDRGKLFTYVRKLDRTILGSFEHEDVSAFFPDPEIYHAYESNR